MALWPMDKGSDYWPLISFVSRERANILRHITLHHTNQNVTSYLVIYEKYPILSHCQLDLCLNSGSVGRESIILFIQSCAKNFIWKQNYLRRDLDLQDNNQLRRKRIESGGWGWGGGRHQKSWQANEKREYDYGYVKLWKKGVVPPHPCPPPPLDLTPMIINVLNWTFFSSINL